jgi:hypothetical protein
MTWQYKQDRNTRKGYRILDWKYPSGQQLKYHHGNKRFLITTFQEGGFKVYKLNGTSNDVRYYECADI